MQKKLIAVLAVLALVVPLSAAMIDDGADAGNTHEAAIDLGSKVVDVGGEIKIPFVNNETAYTSYHDYSMTFYAYTGTEPSDLTNYQIVVMGKTNDGSTESKTVTAESTESGKVTVDVSRVTTEKNGNFNLEITGVSAGTMTVYVKCTMSIIPADSVLPITDNLYYKVQVTVNDVGTSSTITIKDVTVNAGQNLDVTLEVTDVTISTGMNVYATGLPAGVNIINDNDVLKLTGMTTVVGGYTVNVVISNGTAYYTGSFTLTVTAAASGGFTATLTGGGVQGDNPYYVMTSDSGTPGVTLDIVTDYGKFDGTVTADGITFGGPTYVEDNKTTSYSVPINGVGMYVIEIVDTSGVMQKITLNVLPLSTAGAGVIVVGNP